MAGKRRPTARAEFSRQRGLGEGRTRLQWRTEKAGITPGPYASRPAGDTRSALDLRSNCGEAVLALTEAGECKAKEADAHHGPGRGLRNGAGRDGRAALDVPIFGPADVAGEGRTVAGAAVRPDGEQGMRVELRRRSADIKREAVGADRVGLVEIERTGTNRWPGRLIAS